MVETEQLQRERLLAQAREDLEAALRNVELVREADRADICIVCGGAGPFWGVCVSCWKNRLTESQRVTVVREASNYLRKAPLPAERYRRLLGRGF